MKKTLTLLLALITVFSMTACKTSNNEDKTTKTDTKTVDVEKKEENDEKQTDEKSSDSVENFDNYETLSMDISDKNFDFVKIDGKNYLDLKDFAYFLNVSKHRFDVKIDEEKKNIQLMPAMFLSDKDFERITDEDKVEFTEWNLSIKGKKTPVQAGFLKNDALVEPVALADALGFKYEVTDEKNLKLVFDDPDNKVMEVSNDRDYDWYMDQGHTGEYKDGNCGPTSVAMALKWLDQNSAATGESCRGEVVNDGEWWNTNIIESYFDSKNVNYEVKLYKDAEAITDSLDKGDIVLVCIKMGEISQNNEPDKSNMGRFYDFDGGHFLLIKGYKIVDGDLYYQVYDPNNWDMMYSENGEPMGKDRLYKASEMDSAIRSWWSMVYPISQEKK